MEHKHKWVIIKEEVLKYTGGVYFERQCELCRLIQIKVEDTKREEIIQK